MSDVPDVTDTVRIHFNWSIGEPTGFGSRFFMAYTGSGDDPSDLVGVANEVMGLYNTHLKSFFSTSKTLENVQVYDLNGSTSQGISTSSAVVGTESGSDLPANCAAVLRFKETISYRGGHPRMYLPAFTDADSDGQLIWNPTSLSNLVTAWNAFITAFTGYTHGAIVIGAQVNVHLYSGVDKMQPPAGKWRGPPYPYPPKYKSSPVEPNAVTNVSSDPRYGSQRRRLNA